MSTKRRLAGDACEERINPKEELKDFNVKDYEAEVTKDMTEDIEDYLAGKELSEKRIAIQNKVAKKLKDKYFKDGLPKDLPFKIREAINAQESEDKCCDIEEAKLGHSRAVKLSDEDIKKLQSEVKKLQKRQNEIVELVLNKEKYLEKDNLNLMGSYVSEYKKLEGLKSNYLDRLQSAYCAEPSYFDKNFCEAHPVDADHRF